MGVVAALFLVSLFRGGSKKSSNPQGVMTNPQGVMTTDTIETIVECYEASGLYTIVKPKREEPTKIIFDYAGEEEMPSKTNPFVPAGRAFRVFRWPIGSASCDDPQAMHGSRDVDDPSPMMQEGASWYRTLRAALGALGISLKNPFLILLLVIVLAVGLLGGYVLGNTNPIHP